MADHADIYDRAGGIKIRPAKVRGFIVETAPRILGEIPETVVACSTIEEVVDAIRLLFAAEVVVGEVEAPAETCTVIIKRGTEPPGEPHAFIGPHAQERGEQAGSQWNGGGPFRSFTVLHDVPVHR